MHLEGLVLSPEWYLVRLELVLVPVYKRPSVSITSYEYIRILTCCQRKTIIQLTNMTVLFKYLLAVEMVCISTLCLGNGLAESTPTYCIPGPPGRDGRDGRDSLPGPPGIGCYQEAITAEI